MGIIAIMLVAAALGATTGEATEIGPNTATVPGSVTDATSFYVEYENAAADTPEEFGLRTDSQMVTAPGTQPVTARLTGLTRNTAYRYRVVASDGTGTAAGETRTLRTTNPLSPLISSQRSSGVTISGATLTAVVDPRGSATTYHFEYGTSTRYGTQTPTVNLDAGAGPTTVRATLSGLSARTRYHWRLVASNAAGTRRGGDRSFLTARLPTAVSLGLSPARVTWGGALTLGGRVSGTGVDGITVVLEAQPFPFGAAFAPVATARTGRDGGYLFRVDDLWRTTRYRVATRTQTAVVSPVSEARSAVLVGRRVRHVSRRRARVFGSVFPAVRGTATLQRRFGGRWVGVRRQALKRRDSVRSRYEFRGILRVKGRSRSFRVHVRPAAGSANVSSRSRSIRVRGRR
jgi:hypothetical protein